MRHPLSLMLLLALITLGWGCGSSPARIDPARTDPARTDEVRNTGVRGTSSAPTRLPGAQRLPTGLTADDWLSQIAACHLLRVGQNMDVAVTDMAVIAAAEQYGFRVEDIIQRSNVLVQEHTQNGEALLAFAAQACQRVSEATETPSALVRFEPDGTPRSVWLRIDGADIGNGFADETIAELRRRRAVGLVINSPGGSVFEARRLGRFLRAMGYRTAVDRSCTSACIDILAGGVERYITPTAKLGIHQSRVPARFSSHEGGQRYVADSFLYLREMGVDPDVAIAAAAIPNNQILLISLADALKTGLVTDVIERVE